MTDVIDGGLTFSGYLQPPDVPADPTGDAWRGLQGATGATGAQGPVGDASLTSVLATGGTTARSAADHVADGLYAQDFGVTADGVTDDAAALNVLIAAVSTAGGGTIHLPAGTIVSSGIVPKSRVRLVGAGQYATHIKATASPAVAQAPLSQLIGFGLTDMEFLPGSGQAGATVLSLCSFQQCQFGRLLLSGFTTGTLLSIVGIVASPIVYGNGNSNIIYNIFHDITAWGCGTGIYLKGHYGTTPTASPANSANYPDLVATQNTFRDIRLYYVNTAGVLVAGAADTNTFENIWMILGGSNLTGIIGVDLAADPTFTGNSYSNSSKFRGLVMSVISTSVTGTFIKSSDYTLGNEISDFEHDASTTQVGLTFLDTTNMESFRLTGKRIADAGAATHQLMDTRIGMQSTTDTAYADTSTVVVSPSNGQSLQAADGCSLYVLNGASTLATLTVALPANPRNGQSFAISSANGLGVTTLTLTTGGRSITGAITTLATGSYVCWRYYLASNYWLPAGPNRNIGQFPVLAVTGAAATYRILDFQTNLVNRWGLFADNSAESGSNAGSNLFLYGYTDAGAANATASMVVTRSTGKVTFQSGVQIVTGASTIDNAIIGNSTPAAASVTQLNLTTSAGANIRSGTGAASGTQPKGSLWMRTDGGVGTTMYVSQGGGTWNPVSGV
jgi:hypothetical protein